jgi:KDO2-lipid IV(A) lauroyltransferase
VNLRFRYWLFRSLGSVLERLPERIDVGAASTIAEGISHLPGWKRSDLRENIRQVLVGGTGAEVDPDLLDRYLHRGLHSYGRYWGEGAKLPAMRPSDVTARLRFSEGEQHLRDAVHSGRGVIVALPHVGSWEWGAMFLADVGWPMTAVVERLEPPDLFEWFVAKREAIGLSVIPLDDGAGGAVARVLRDGGTVGLLCDRDLQRNGIEVDLLGATTTVPAGPATLAIRSGAILLCAAVYSGPGRDHHVVVTPPIDTSRQGRLREDVARVTQDVARELGWLIRRAPEQWHVLQRNWPATS